MNNPRPKKPQADYPKMPVEKLLSLLEQRLPGFTMSFHHTGKDRPVMVNWRHQHQKLMTWEQSNLLMHNGTFRDFKTALVAILERQDAYEEHVAAENFACFCAARKSSPPLAPKPKPAPAPKKPAAEPEDDGPILNVQHTKLDELAEMSALLDDANRKE